MCAFIFCLWNGVHRLISTVSVRRKDANMFHNTQLGGLTIGDIDIEAGIGVSGIDFYHLSLRDLRAILPSTDGLTPPSKKWLRENPQDVFCSAKFKDALLTVYRNGFYSYSENGHTSVLRVDGFHSLHYEFQDGTVLDIEEKVYLDCHYLTALFVNIQNRVERNAIKRGRYREKLSIDTANEDYIGSVLGVEAFLEANESDSEERRQLRKVLATLPQTQMEVIHFHFVKNMTQKGIAQGARDYSGTCFPALESRNWEVKGTPRRYGI